MLGLRLLWITGPATVGKSDTIELSCAAYSPDDISYAWTVSPTGAGTDPDIKTATAATTLVEFRGKASIKFTFTCTVTNKKSTPSTFTDTHVVTSGA